MPNEAEVGEKMGMCSGPCVKKSPTSTSSIHEETSREALRDEKQVHFAFTKTLLRYLKSN
jgi:hypothetical protein